MTLLDVIIDSLKHHLINAKNREQDPRRSRLNYIYFIYKRLNMLEIPRYK